MEQIEEVKSESLSSKKSDLKSFSFEKYKVKIELLKWVIGTVGLTLITLIINWGFKDREQGMNELLQYDKYATELIVFNDNPINKRMIAQFFSHVTPSEKLKKGWEAYFKAVDAEYQKFLVKDSIEKAKFNEFLKKDSTELTKEELIEKNNLKESVAENERIKSTPIHIPNNNTSRPGLTIFIKSVNAMAEAEKAQTALSGFRYRVPAIEEIEPGNSTLRDNEIRYFFESERLSVLEVQELLSAQNIETTIQYIPHNAQRNRRGAIELWIAKGGGN